MPYLEFALTNGDFVEIAHKKKSSIPSGTTSLSGAASEREELCPNPVAHVEGENDGSKDAFVRCTRLNFGGCF